MKNTTQLLLIFIALLAASIISIVEHSSIKENINIAKTEILAPKNTDLCNRAYFLISAYRGQCATILVYNPDYTVPIDTLYWDMGDLQDDKTLIYPIGTGFQLKVVK